MSAFHIILKAKPSSSGKEQSRLLLLEFFKLEIETNHVPLVRVLVEDEVFVGQGFVHEKNADLHRAVRTHNHAVGHAEIFPVRRGADPQRVMDGFWLW